MTSNETASQGPESSLPYTEAVAELETILLDLENDDVDIDALTSQVKRASELIQLCRTRITAATVEVEQIVAELQDQTETDTVADHADD